MSCSPQAKQAHPALGSGGRAEKHAEHCSASGMLSSVHVGQDQWSVVDGGTSSRLGLCGGWERDVATDVDVTGFRDEDGATGICFSRGRAPVAFCAGCGVSSRKMKSGDGSRMARGAGSPAVSTLITSVTLSRMARWISASASTPCPDAQDFSSLARLSAAYKSPHISLASNRIGEAVT